MILKKFVLLNLLESLRRWLAISFQKLSYLFHYEHSTSQKGWTSKYFLFGFSKKRKKPRSGYSNQEYSNETSNADRTDSTIAKARSIGTIRHASTSTSHRTTISTRFGINWNRIIENATITFNRPRHNCSFQWVTFYHRSINFNLI